MLHDKLRRKIAFEAARLIVAREECDVQGARRRAAGRVAATAFRPEDLPSDAEIHEQLRLLTEDRADFAERNRLSGDAPLRPGCEDVERFHYYRSLLLPLEKVTLDPLEHPEGDALYHSLQVFEIAREELPYDEEFLLAALLHEVGQAIDPRNAVAAGLLELGDSVTPRTRWLIEHHGSIGALREGELGARSRRRLQADESYEELALLHDCDRRGRRRGAVVPELDDALEHLREMARLCEGGD